MKVAVSLKLTGMSLHLKEENSWIVMCYKTLQMFSCLFCLFKYKANKMMLGFIGYLACVIVCSSLRR